jgi:hypothetical protein
MYIWHRKECNIYRASECLVLSPPGSSAVPPFSSARADTCGAGYNAARQSHSSSPAHQFNITNQCCGSGSGIRYFFTPRIRDPDPGWSNGRIRIRDKTSRIRNTVTNYAIT